MRLAIRLLGLDLLAIDISTDDAAEVEYVEAVEPHPDLGSDAIYSEPTGALGFSMPSTDYGYDE